MSVAALLNRTLEVFRPVRTADGAGGRTTTMTFGGRVRARVSQPGQVLAGGEKKVAAQATARADYQIYLLPGADVQRRDELRSPDGTQVYQVLAVVEPSAAVYRRADCLLQQAEPTGL